MTVSKLIQFNQHIIMTTGTVLKDAIYEGHDCWLVDFSHEGFKYRGWWRKDECKLEAQKRKTA